METPWRPFHCQICLSKHRCINDVFNTLQWFFSIGQSVGVMVWCAINGNGEITWERCPDFVKAEDYQKILEKKMSFIRPSRYSLVFDSYPTTTVCLRATSKKREFMQDGASVHTAKSTQLFLKKSHVVRFNDGNWPPQSPDMNPVEHIWPLVTRAQSSFCG